MRPDAAASPSRRRPGRRPLAGRLAALAALLSALLLAADLGAFLMGPPGPAPDGIRTDGVVVLTGGAGRLQRGAEVLRQGLAGRLLVSGVDPQVTPEELRRALDLPPKLFEDQVDIGFRAENTRANAEEVAEWAGQHRLRSIRVVTSDYHARRAKAEIAARLPPGVGLVVDAVPGEAPPRLRLREYGKYLAARLRIAVARP